MPGSSKAFSIYKNAEEFKRNSVLRWALGALTLQYFVIFYSWIQNPTITLSTVAEGLHLCPAYFQSCGQWYFLEALPDGYSQTYFYMLLFGLLVWSVYLFKQQRWNQIVVVLTVPFLWHALNIFVFSEMQGGNYDYYTFVFGLILLFLPHKEFFLKVTLVLFYMLSTVAKIHPAWIEGTYFSTLRLGLPLFPDWSIPIWTNVVILMEMVGAWFLFAKNQLVQRSVLVFFVLFHLYSGILVEYRYPATVLPMLLILFGPWYRHTPIPLDRRARIGWLLIIVLCLLQFTPRFISGDEKLTLEGNRYGLYMFESNHQCISTAVLHDNDGNTAERTQVGVTARHRCNPYAYWFRLQSWCDYDTVSRIEWTFDHSINGEPFLRIVDTENLCQLEYDPFGRNEWIKTHEDNPDIIGQPVRNYYR